MALVHLIATLLATWTFSFVVDCLVAPTAIDEEGSNATNSSKQDNKNNMVMPGGIVLTLTMKNETITLNLTRNTNIPSDVPVVVAANGTQTTWKPNSNQFAVYYEMNSSASIVIEMKNQNGQLIKNCRGTLLINGNYYSIQPVDNSYGNHSSEEFIVDIDGVDHVMWMEDADMDFADLMNSSITQKKTSNGPNLMEMFYDWPSGFQRYVVEMAIFVDYALFYRWYSRSQARDHWGRYYDAVLNIQYYFVQVANGVDMRYSTIRESDFSINVRLVGIYIAASPSESYWTERSDVTFYYDSAGYTDMRKALQLFEEWLPSKMTQMGFTFDQATAFTGNNLFDPLYCSGGVSCTRSGLAESQRICQLSGLSALSVSINKDFGIYSSIQTAAHELGHNLGANHDGDQNACSGSDQYIMASAPNPSSTSNFNNAFTFSSCSLWYFRNQLARITMDGKGNCLLVGSSSPTVVAPQNFAAYPGQQYSADQQCQNMLGSSSYYCAGGGSRDQTICKSMECWVPEKGFCYATAEQRAYDGTKCGNYKWCMNGQCVYDGRSQATLETCIYGDYKDRVPVFSGVLMPCYDMGRLQPHSCYLNRTAGDCCQTCANIRDNSKPSGCAYGDKNPDFCRSRPKRSECYQASFADMCCDSCNRGKSSVVDCEYGDKIEWCSTVSAYACYQSGKDCCETCQKFYDSRYPGCEYGDQVPWCTSTTLTREVCTSSTGTLCCASCRSILANSNPTIDAVAICPQGDQASYCSYLLPSQCYSSSSTCCPTCSRYRVSPYTPGCEFGDKAEWCASYVKGPTECMRPEVADLCCHRCAQYKGNGPTDQVCTDNAPWCSNIFAGDCYDSQTASTCCNICNRYKRNNKNCPYGNRYSWCRAEFCSINRSECCEVCS